MTKFIFVLAFLIYLVVSDSSAEDKTDGAVASSGEFLQHSVVKREAGKPKKKNKGKRTRGRKKVKNPKRKGGKRRKGNARPRIRNNIRQKQENKRKNTGRKFKKSKNRQTEDMNYTACAMKMKDFASRIKKAGNLERQAIRIGKYKNLNIKKTDKKGDFNKTLATLTTALGGNSSKPACRQSGVNFTEHFATLQSCMMDIESSCKLDMSSNDTADVAVCEAAGKDLFAEVDDCIKPAKTLMESCTCFMGLTTDNLDKVKNCDIKSKNTKVTESKKNCTSGFSKCKKAQDSAVEIVDMCKPERKCGGAGSKAEAEEQLAVLTPLSDALKNTGFADALKAAGLDTGTGSNGELPPSRVARAAAGEGEACVSILNDWKSFNSSADKAVPAIDGDIDETETNNTIGTLNKLNNNANLTNELDTCQKETSRQSVTVTLAIVEIRFFVFWCGWFQVFVVEIKITIIEVTFGVGPGITEAPVTQPPVTTVAARNRKNLRRNLLFH